MLTKKWSFISIIFYIIFGIFYDDLFLRFHPYGNYIFDLSFVIFFLIKMSSEIHFKGGWGKSSFIQYGLSLISGFLVYKAALHFKIAIPFDLKGTEVLLFLLIIGPILEEFIFRFCILYLLRTISSSKFLIILFSSLLFSLSHFVAYFDVPKSIGIFVIYQSAYTFLIAIWWGYSYIKSKSLTIPCFLHIFFNFGFYLASQFALVRI